MLAYLRHERELSPNSLYTVGKDLRRLFGYLRDERGLSINVEPRKLRVACQDTDKVYLSAQEAAGLLGLLTSAQLAGLCQKVGQTLYSDCRALGMTATYRASSGC